MKKTFELPEKIWNFHLFKWNEITKNCFHIFVTGNSFAFTQLKKRFEVWWFKRESHELNFQKCFQRSSFMFWLIKWIRGALGNRYETEMRMWKTYGT